MKKQISITFLFSLLMSMVGTNSFAHDIEVANSDGKTVYYKWTNNNTELEVSCRGAHFENYSNEYSGNIVIPESVTYNGTTYPVTSIDGAAFDGCSSLTSVTIPNSVTTIGSGAFADCSGLTSITIPNSVTSIGGNAFYGTAWYNNQPDGLVYVGKVAYKYKGTMPDNTKIVLEDGTLSITNEAFSGCSGLASVTIPSSVTSIGDYAFYGCSGLTSITIPNSVTSIGHSAFYSCSSLTSVTISNSVTSIGYYAFEGCSGLTSITIPNSVTSIGEQAFSNCSGLTSITIPNSVTNIGFAAFAGCSSLTSITIPNSVTSIGRGTFSGCNSLLSITIPNTITSIGSGAFWNCSGLTSVHISDLTAWCNISFSDGTSNPLYYAHRLYMNEQEVTSLVIPDGVTSIGHYAFFGCSGLTSVTIPNGVTKIENEAFCWCSGLASITIPNSVTTIGEQAFLRCYNVVSLKLPDNLQLIRPSTFQYCSKLKSVTIPSTVEVIYQEAFAGCNSLESVTSQAANPPFLYDNSFSNYSVPLNVPSGCKSAYEDAQGWRNFTNISDGNMYYQLSITATGQGTATYNDTPVKNTTATFDVKEGNSATITISADNGYAVSTATVNGEDATAAIVNGVLTISSMSANTTVAITFARASATAAITLENDMQTYCPLDDVDFSNVEGLKAFTATGYDHGTLTVSRVLNAPAGTGLLLQGTAGVTYQVPYATQTGYYINLLHGLTQDTQVSPTTGDQTNFLLGKKNGVTTFYRVAQTGTVSAGKAYLQLPTSVVGDLSGSRVMRIVADDETTGISETLSLNDNGEMTNDNVYDLQGRRVTKPTRGLYIVNGKKVVIK